MSEATWTISELATQAVNALAAHAPQNGRTREIPNERLIRWYTTIGLLDPPVRRGRTAYYGTRHLLQLVAVKRLQATGHSIAEIQASLTGAPTPVLESIADLPEPTADRPRFWAERPAVPARELPPAGILQGVRLAPGAALLLEGARRGLTEEEVAAVRTAAGPLLATLAELGLIATEGMPS